MSRVWRSILSDSVVNSIWKSEDLAAKLFETALANNIRAGVKPQSEKKL